MPSYDQPDVLDRNLGEILQEIRVAQTGVQILFAFLLSLPFTSGFHSASAPDRAVYLTALLATVGAASMLIAPVAFHRILFRRRRRPDIVRGANRFAIVGLALMVVGVSAAVMFATSFVVGTMGGCVIGAIVLAWFSAWWFGVPFHHLHRRDDHPVTVPVTSSSSLHRPTRHAVAHARSVNPR
ncbi:MAG: DUF6328 family protein [Oryzihumus sp.]